jgi:hypothetical protein
MPWKHIDLYPDETAFISFPAGFAGRVQRGTDNLNLTGNPQYLTSRFEFAMDNSPEVL